ncbi:MAG: N-acetylmuramic acid 6-phosphate etherase [Cyanobacteria bacterium J06639_1]
MANPSSQTPSDRASRAEGDRGHLLTEAINPASADLDLLSPLELVDVINAEDAKAVAAVASQREAVAKAIALAAAALKAGGRIFYVGAGTSGRLGVLDAAECPPTFRADPEQVQGIIAGGSNALVRSAEGKEDEWDGGKAAIAERAITDRDFVLGIAAGGTTPYVHGALAEARDRGAKTGFFACVSEDSVPMQCDVNIRPLVGPEVVTGSTRMKAGTATKLVLNAISTGAMVQIGKTYGNYMVDVTVSNVKLRDRALRTIQKLTECDRSTADNLLESAHLQVKPALLMFWAHCTYDEAKQTLASCEGSLRRARQQLG